jgi:hypothetical protein
MPDEDTRDLDAILAHYDAKLAEKHSKEQQEKDAQLAFAEAFEGLCAGVLQPRFAAYQAKLEAVGHAVAIRREVGREGRDGLPRPAIYLDIVPKETPRSHSRTELPSIGFICEPQTRTIALAKRCAMPSGGGLGGGREEFPLDAITAEFCDQHVLDLLRRTLGRP